MYNEVLALWFSENPVEVPTGAVLKSTGKPNPAKTVFGGEVSHDLRVGFPLTRLRPISFDIVKKELAWMLSGSTNVNALKEQGVHIWDAWADEKGDLGPVYGAQWRNFGGVDQLKQLLEEMAAVIRNPADRARRRLIVSAWNPKDVTQMALPPCHAFFQVSILQGRLSLKMYQRSADLFLGVPYNIASYALLTMALARLFHLTPHRFIHSFGDLHVYANHQRQVNELFLRHDLDRRNWPVVRLGIAKDQSVESLIELVQTATIEGYHPGEKLTGEVSV
jgi:thymidylate synthase